MKHFCLTDSYFCLYLLMKLRSNPGVIESPMKGGYHYFWSWASAHSASTAYRCLINFVKGDRLIVFFRDYFSWNRELIVGHLPYQKCPNSTLKSYYSVA